jgi:hypothetical protein
MSDKITLNGCDYLMLGFDRELRRQGFAGNGCQIVLNLASPILPSALQQQLDLVWGRHPLLGAHPGGWIMPQWKARRKGAPPPQVRVHADEVGLEARLFNEPLALVAGELARFDLVQRQDGHVKLIFTWAHALMDAPGAEQLLAGVGCAGLPARERMAAAPGREKESLQGRMRTAWKYLHHLDLLCKAPPRAIGRRHPNAPARLEYRVERFSREETERVRANGRKHCGFLADARYHAAVSALELHRLHLRLGCPSPSYVLPIPVRLRLQGAVDPLFSNQVTMLMHQFLPADLESIGTAAKALQTQTTEALRQGLVDSGRVLGELFRFLPLPIYMTIVKQGLRGEICSLFYGDIGDASPWLGEFLGARVLDLTHIAAVTPSPGLGVIFYYFRGEMRLTVLHSAQVLSDAEAVEFSTGLRARLLDP